jgi:hypothetical protein
MYHALVQDFSRRGFVAGAAAAGAAVAASGLLQGAQAAKADEAAASSYKTAPEPVADDQISETIETDVVVIGTGVSGMCMGCRLAELGVDFRIFSAGTQHVQRGGSFHGIDTKLHEAYGISYKKADLAHRIKQECMAGSYFIDQRKWSKWLNNNTEAMNWMMDKAEGYGARFVLETGYQDEDGLFDFEAASHNLIMVDESLTQENGGIFGYTTDFGAFMGAGLLNDVYQHEIEQVVPIDWRTKAEYLVREDDNTGRVSAVVAQKLDEDGNPTGEYVKYVGKKGIVMATGDFSQDHELMAEKCPWIVANDMLTEYPVNYDATFQFGGVMPGDGQKMGLWVGAAWQKSGNACLIDSLDGPYHKAIGNVEIINLNKNGQRFTNEDVICSYSAIAALQQPGHTVYYVWPAEYADKYETWDNFGATLPSPEDGVQYPAYCSYTAEEMAANWETQVAQGNYVKGSSVREVLEGLEDIDVEAALATIEQYNQYCADGYDPEFMKAATLLDAIDSPSGVYYGYKITMGPSNFLGSTGGLRTNEDMQVCDENDEPIEGLYNIGVMVGDMYANTYNFAICGHNLSATCTTFPYLLAQDFADMA